MDGRLVGRGCSESGEGGEGGGGGSSEHYFGVHEGCT